MVWPLPHPRPIPDEFLKAIGLIAVEWAHLENTLGKLLCRLLGLPFWGQGQAVTAHIPFRTRIDIALAYARERRQIKPEQIEELDALLKEIDCKRRDRNTYIHGEWGFYPNAGAVVVNTISAHEKLKQSGGQVCSQQLETLAQEIVVLNGRLEALGGKIATTTRFG
jgi:hypothetical protein